MSPRLRSRNCTNMGKITRNPFLNFVRHSKVKGPPSHVAVTVKKAAQQWKKLSKRDRLPFIVEAKNAEKNSFVKPFYTLNEQVLGKRCRRYLDEFKSAVDTYVEVKLKSMSQPNL